MFYIKVLATSMLCRYISVWWELAQLIFPFYPIQMSLQSHMVLCIHYGWEREWLSEPLLSVVWFMDNILGLLQWYPYSIFSLYAPPPLFLFMQVGRRKQTFLFVIFLVIFPVIFPVYLWREAAMLLLASNSKTLMRYLRSPNGEPAHVKKIQNKCRKCAGQSFALWIVLSHITQNCSFSHLYDCSWQMFFM